MANKELINYVDNELTAEGWWCEESKDKFHKACVTMLSYGVGVDAIKDILHDLYYAVAAEYGN